MALPQEPWELTTRPPLCVLQVDGKTVNFFVHYEIDNDTSKHVLMLDNYGGDAEESWVLLEPVPGPAPAPELAPVPTPAVPEAEVEAEPVAPVGSRRSRIRTRRPDPGCIRIRIQPRTWLQGRKRWGRYEWEAKRCVTHACF